MEGYIFFLAKLLVFGSHRLLFIELATIDFNFLLLQVLLNDVFVA